MCIESIGFTLPFCGENQEEESKSSLILRIMAVGIGAIALLMGALILCGIPHLSTLGTTGGIVFLALGAILLASSCLRRFKESDQPDPENSTQVSAPKPEEIETYYDLTGNKTITSDDICDYLLELAWNNPKFKTRLGAAINDEKNTVVWTATQLLEDPKNASAEALAFDLNLAGSKWHHHTLVYIDCIKRTVEFYDNVVTSANHEKVAIALTEVAKICSERKPGLPFKFEPKITKPILRKSRDCGAWVMYFAKERLANPNIDFNKYFENLTTQQKKDLMRNFRVEVTNVLTEMGKRLDAEDDARREKIKHLEEREKLLEKQAILVSQRIKNLEEKI